MDKFLKDRLNFIFWGIIILATVLRFYLLGVNPPSLNWDEASIGYNAYSILKTGADEYGNHLPLSFRSFDDYKPPVYIYLTVPSVAIFGLNELGVRFPAAFFGVLAVIATYFFVKELFVNWDKRTTEWIALFSAFFLAISPWHLQFSRAAYEGNVGVFFLVLSCLCFLKGLKNEKYYWGFAASFILSIYSYHSFRLINPVIMIALILLFFKQINKKNISFILSIILVVLISLPIYVNLFGPGQTSARLSMVTIFSDPTMQMESAKRVQEARQNHDVIGEVVNNRRLFFIPAIVKGYFDHFNFDFLFLHGDGGVQHHAYNMGMLYIWDLPFILLGLYFLIKKMDRRILLLLIIFLLAPLPASITTGTPHPVRAIAMIPAFQIFSAVGLVVLLLYISRIKSEVLNINLKYLISSLIILFLIFNISYYLYSYYVLTPIKYGYFWQYGNKEAINYAKENETKYNKIIMTYKYDQPYVYYLFYNKIDPAWYQKNWNYNGSGQMDRFKRIIGKYEFKNINFSIDSQGQKTLIIGAPDEIPQNVNVKRIINFPDGRVAYKIVET